MVGYADTLRDGFRQNAIDTWLGDLARPESKSGKGRNKLRTYARFKKDIEFEPYLNCVHHDCKRMLLFKFRIGIAPLRIETGRYESVVDVLTGDAKKGIDESSRTCLCCYSAIEDEQHMLLTCPCYTSERYRFLEVFRQYCVNLKQRYPYDLNTLFVKIMSCTDRNVIIALANFLWLAFQRREQIIVK